MDIAKIFNSKTRKELFQLYFTNPDNAYYLRELERILNIPVSMVRNELMHLEKNGIFISQKKGNLIYYSLNKSYALFKELKSIVFKTVGACGALKEVLNKINGIEAAFIYGSFAKEQENASSDIDLLIVGEVDEDKLMKKVEELEKRLHREINYSTYPEKEFRDKIRKKDSFILNILRRPKIILKGSLNGF